MRISQWISGVFMAALVLPLLAFAADDPAVGIWKMNVAKSVVPAELGIKGMTRVYMMTPNGMSITETQELTTGAINTVKYVFRYDGKDYPVTGSSLYDALAVKETSKGVTESTLKLKGAVVGHSARRISKDGKSMSFDATIKVSGKDTTLKYEFDKQ